MKRLLLASSLFFPLQAAAVLPYDFTDAEVRALPPVCAAMIKGNAGRYTAQFGAHNMAHMHHYCHAVKFVNRARAHSQDRRFYLSSAKGEYEYVVKHAAKDFWFRPQVYLELARVHMQLGETAEAQSLLQAAIVFNRSFEPAYASLIELQVGMGARGLALETATEGLKYLPDSKRLQQAYLANGGKKPFPEAAVKAAPPVAAEVELPTPQERDPAAPEEGAAEESAPVESQQTNAEPAVDGSCRFCPPEEIQQRWRESFQTGQ